MKTLLKTGLWLVVLFLNPFYSIAQESGLLFYLSGDRGLEADYAVGDPHPNYVYNISMIPDGAKGPGIHCAHRQLLSYWAHKNIYAQRGTLSFYWRADEPLTETEFPLFRVAYADHSSWDMVWLRIDYNGHGFDAFVTDVNLARVRTSYKIPKLPAPDEWVHLALAWDETQGIRFYVNGEKVGQRDTTVVLNAALDQFGPHSRIISPYQVQSAYNFIRGGDIDEVRIYDQMLDQSKIVALAQGHAVEAAPVKRNLEEQRWRNQWNLQYGWNRPDDLPPYLENETTRVRKVQILEAYDLKRWWWRANDGIRETTWPGVYNRSRIIGRNDYFQLPDWDCYSTSGWSIRFNMPDEPWNYLEVSGGADGKIALTPNPDGTGGQELFVREPGNERTFHSLASPVTGQTVVFTNNEQETPIGEFDAFYVHAGDAPQGIGRLQYTLTSKGSSNNPNIDGILDFIERRYLADERSVLLAEPGRAGGARKAGAKNNGDQMPLVHLIIPSDFRSVGPGNTVDDKAMPRFMSYTWHNMNAGLDGIRITLPAMDVRPVAGGLFPMNIQVKDPVWPLRNMLDFSFSVKPNEERVLWLDLRDRVLPDFKPLYITLAGGGADFHSGLLEGARIELVFKKRADAVAEHTVDRFTQVKDNHAMIVEEHPRNRRLDKYNQIEADFTDLFRVDPEHRLGQEYWYFYNGEQPRPEVEIAPAPQGVPEWAHLQLTLLKEFRHFLEWMIDNRQIENGEFGGGISDDTDFTNMFPQLALMGVMPEKLDHSLSLLLEAAYNNGMLTDGMSTIMTDGLHTFEEGVNTIIQLNLLRMGDPKTVERMMEAAYGVKHHITGVNKAGHTHFKSDYFSATQMATGVWGWSFHYAAIHLIAPMMLAEFYGSDEARQLIVDLADGYLAHAYEGTDGKLVIDCEINFEEDISRPSGIGSLTPVFWAAWKYTGDDKFLRPVLERGVTGMRSITSNLLDQADLRDTFGQEAVRMASGKGGNNSVNFVAWQMTGDKSCLEENYRDQIGLAKLREYLYTEGSIWIDRLSFPAEDLQRSRLGGVAIGRNQIYTGHTVSWRFEDEHTGENVAILVPYSTQKGFEVEFFNTENREIEVEMTGGDVYGGKWRLTYGTDTDGDGRMDRQRGGETVDFGRNESVRVKIPSRRHAMIKMELEGPGEWLCNRPDLAIGREDIRVRNNQVTVTVHNLGGKAAPASRLGLVDQSGQVVAQVALPALESAADMLPKRTTVTLRIPRGMKAEAISVVVDPQNELAEISKKNNRLPL